MQNRSPEKAGSEVSSLRPSTKDTDVGWYGAAENGGVGAEDDFECYSPDLGKNILYNVRLSRAYLVFCLVNTLLATMLLGFCIYWMFLRGKFNPDTPTALWFVACESIVTGFLCLETSFCITLLGKEYFKSFWNLFDLFVAIISAVNLIMEILDVMGRLSGIETNATIALIALRYLTQVVSFEKPPELERAPPETVQPEEDPLSKRPFASTHQDYHHHHQQQQQPAVQGMHLHSPTRGPAR
uniref:Ion transport domain-containing protein n=1 Tax=Chromera velia CCMP2878 TaxID=1169474 RepID=A0A0G4IDW8_9ALVE|eukprot:Cvel_13554.t1-p1 / transcript=Cvel_13554.t1 / gene=Cvel_13554 / organism=Chromera_velia_CCMP2878 / gene_product=hypothetical protein / transcript_product=hypothetical protein / location=Cvel_scaffold931:20926-24670(-) / protein_length=240 / sequence_SO=supercontig / SO=protein_coding / is_pseudo=false